MIVKYLVTVQTSYFPGTVFGNLLVFLYILRTNVSNSLSENVASLHVHFLCRMISQPFFFLVSVSVTDITKIKYSNYSKQQIQHDHAKQPACNHLILLWHKTYQHLSVVTNW